MARVNRKEDFLTFVGDGDERALPNTSERDLAAELYRKSYQGNVVDAFEKAQGIVPKKQKQNRHYKTRVFEPKYEKEQELLSKLMNSPQYKIEMWKDTWTVDGSFKIFILYSEDMDFKTQEEKVKDIAEGTTNE